MSRVGNRPISVPKNVTIVNNGNLVEVRYQSQTRTIELPKNVIFSLEADIVKLSFTGVSKESVKDWGTFRQNLNNIIKGLVDGFSKKVFLVGTGFKAEVKGNFLRLYLGHSHPFYYLLPEGVKAIYDKASNSISVTANNKEILGDLVRNLKNLRKVEPYKGKGVRIEGEVVIRKESKTKK